MSFHTKKTSADKDKVSTSTPLENSAENFRKWFPELGEDIQKKLLVYLEELLKFNKTINLISPSSAHKADAIHFADSVKASQVIEPMLVPNQDVYDFGSGNGFPGLVMACLYAKHNFILVERDVRKAEFLKHMISNLKLANAKVLVKSVEDLPDSSCHNVILRGFAALHKSMLIARKPMAKGGKLFHLKGDNFSTELAAVPSQLFSHWNATLAGNYCLPDTNSVETIVLTEKLSD